MAGLIPFNRNAKFPEPFDFYNMLDDFFNDGWMPRRSLMSDTFKVDVREDGKEYTIEAELPGVKKEEIGLSFDDGRLTLSVNRQEETNTDEKNYIHRERRYTSMQRSVYLADADEQNISAKLNDGILMINIPKLKKGTAARAIEIQ